MPAVDRPGRRWGTVREAAQLVGVHEMTIRTWLAEKRIKGGRLGRCIRVDLQALEAMLEGGQATKERGR